MLTLPRTLSFTPSQFAQVCAANPEAVLELDADGTLIEMTPPVSPPVPATRPPEPCSGLRSSRAGCR
jgi:Uma2 family endonuclease